MCSALVAYLTEERRLNLDMSRYQPVIEGMVVVRAKHDERSHGESEGKGRESGLFVVTFAPPVPASSREIKSRK